MATLNARNVAIMRDAYLKLDNMVLSFGLPKYTDEMSDTDVNKYLGMDLKDTLRELRLLDCSDIAEMSIDEMNIEDRVVYYALRRFRNSSSVFFKFSTATDGKSIDKSMIPKMILQIMQEYDTEWKRWKSTSANSSLWSRTSTVATNGNYSTSS